MTTIVQKVAAAIVATGAVLGANAAMAQDAATEAPQQLTAEEGKSLKGIFDLQSCVQSQALEIQMGAMFGAITPEDAEQQIDAVVASCETSTGITEEGAQAVIADLEAKYGDDLDVVIDNSKGVIFKPVSEMTDKEKAAVTLAQEFQSCGDVQMNAYEQQYDVWYNDAIQQLDAGTATEEELLANAPAKPDVMGICSTQLGVDDATLESTQNVLNQIDSVYGPGTLDELMTAPAAPAPGGMN